MWKALRYIGFSQTHERKSERVQQGAQINRKMLALLAVEACASSRSGGSEQASLCSISASFLARAMIICKFTGIIFLKSVGSCVASPGQKGVSRAQCYFRLYMGTDCPAPRQAT